MKHTESRSVIVSLLDSAGIEQTVHSVEPIGDGVTNRTSLVVLQDDTRYILREYEWPYATNDDLQRVEKEIYLHDLLLKHDVPVPAIVAHLDDESARAVLMEFKPGDLLGNVVDTLTEVQRAQAWRTVGAALRKVHTIQLPGNCSGLIVGERVRPFEEGSWGDFHYH